jgi:hypothetical protein
MAALDAMKARLRSISAAFTETNRGLDVKDPAGNLARVSVA